MSLLAGIAVLRFPDTMSRIHAATKPQVLGIMLLMLGLGLRLGSPGVIGMLVLIVILQFVTAPVSAHLTVRVAYRNAQDDEPAEERRRRSAADDGPAQMAQGAADEPARVPGRISGDAKQPDGNVRPDVPRSTTCPTPTSQSTPGAAPMMRDLRRHAGGRGPLDDLSPAGSGRAADDSGAAHAAGRPGGAVGRHRRRHRPGGASSNGSRCIAIIYESGWSHAKLNVIASPVQNVRMVFDLMPTESDDEVDDPGPADGRRAGRAGRLPGKSAAAADGGAGVPRCGRSTSARSSATPTAGDHRHRFLRRAGRDPSMPAARGPALSPTLTAGAAAADAAYAALGGFLRSELRPHAPEKDAVGRERYELASRDFLGAAVDLEETYAWGWDEFLAASRPS